MHHHLRRHQELVDLERTHAHDRWHERSDAIDAWSFFVTLHLRAASSVHSMSVRFNLRSWNHAVQAAYWSNHRIDDDEDSVNLLRQEQDNHSQCAHSRSRRWARSMSFSRLSVNERYDSQRKIEMIEFEELCELRLTRDNQVTVARSSHLLLLNSIMSSCIIDFSHSFHWKNQEQCIIWCDRSKLKSMSSLKLQKFWQRHDALQRLRSSRLKESNSKIIRKTEIIK